MSRPELPRGDCARGHRRVCVFCDVWSSGGIESFLHNVLLHLEPGAPEVDIVASELRGSIFTEDLEQIGVRFFELSGNQRDILSNDRRFRALLAERQYDVLHLNLFHGLSLRYAAIARQAGIPGRIVHSHGAGLRRSGTKPLKLALHRLGKALWAGAATEFWACSQSAASFLFPAHVLSSGRVRWVPNGIDTERFRFREEDRLRLREELELEGCQIGGYVGRLSSEKNPLFLLRVLACLADRRPDFRLLVVGDGELREQMESEARSMGLRERVIFYGVSPRVERLLSAMDVFLFPSLMEGLGIAAVEAQASGLPVICSDAVPPEARLTERFHALPLTAGPAAWAEAILRLSPAEGRAGAAAQVREGGFDIRDVADQVQAAYMR